MWAIHIHPENMAGVAKIIQQLPGLHLIPLITCDRTIGTKGYNHQIAQSALSFKSFCRIQATTYIT